jgi:hypothetical protein
MDTGNFDREQADVQKDGEPRPGKTTHKKASRLLPLLLILVLLVGAYFFYMHQREKAPSAPQMNVKEAERAKKTSPPTPTSASAGSGSMGESPETRRTPVENMKGYQHKPEHFYQVKPGDTLSKIAALPEIYGDYSKWDLLYLANPEVVDYFYRKERIPYVVLQPGVRLRIPDLYEGESLLNAEAKGRFWVVQLSSNLKLLYALLAATQLKDLGHVYVMEDTSSKEVWYVVRIGFFESKEEANEKARVALKETGPAEYLLRPISAYEVHNYLPFAARAKGQPPARVQQLVKGS